MVVVLLMIQILFSFCPFFSPQVPDKFCLDLTDEEAVHYIQSVIDASASATVAALMEQMHKFAQV